MIVVRQLSSSLHKYHQKQEISSQALNIRVSHLIIVILGTVKFALGGKMLLITFFGDAYLVWESENILITIVVYDPSFFYVEN